MHFWFPSASQAPLLKDGENIYTCMTKNLASIRVPWQKWTPQNVIWETSFSIVLREYS